MAHGAGGISHENGLAGELVNARKAARGKQFVNPFKGRNLGQMAGVIRFTEPIYRGRSYGMNALAVMLQTKARLAGDEAVPLSQVPLGKQAKDTIDGLPSRGNADRAVNPSSRFVTDGPSHWQGAEYFMGNERDLNSGPAPAPIRRLTTARNAGYVKPGAGQAGGNGTAGSFGSIYIPHQRIPRHPITVSPFRRTVDTQSTIPARGIGAPVK